MQIVDVCVQNDVVSQSSAKSAQNDSSEFKQMMDSAKSALNDKSAPDGKLASTEKKAQSDKSAADTECVDATGNAVVYDAIANVQPDIIIPDEIVAADTDSVSQIAPVEASAVESNAELQAISGADTIDSTTETDTALLSDNSVPAVEGNVDTSVNEPVANTVPADVSNDSEEVVGSANTFAEDTAVIPNSFAQKSDNVMVESAAVNAGDSEADISVGSANYEPASDVNAVDVNTAEVAENAAANSSEEYVNPDRGGKTENEADVRADIAPRNEQRSDNPERIYTAEKADNNSDNKTANDDTLGSSDAAAQISYKPISPIGTGESVAVTFDKISERLTAESVETQIVDEIYSKFNSGETDFELQLNPSNLGTVTVKMAVRDAKLVIELLANDARTQNIIISNSSELKSMLENQMNQPINIEVVSDDQPKFDYSEGHAQQQNSQESQKNESGKSDEQNGSFTADFLSIMQLVSGTNS